MKHLLSAAFILVTLCCGTQAFSQDCDGLGKEVLRSFNTMIELRKFVLASEQASNNLLIEYRTSMRVIRSRYFMGLRVNCWTERGFYDALNQGWTIPIENPQNTVCGMLEVQQNATVDRAQQLLRDYAVLRENAPVDETNLRETEYANNILNLRRIYRIAMEQNPVCARIIGTY